MRILIDTNVVLDLALDRQPFASDAQAIFEALDQPELTGLITATTITDLYYVLRKVKGKEVTLAFLTDLLQVVDVAGVEQDIFSIYEMAGIVEGPQAASHGKRAYLGVKAPRSNTGARLPLNQKKPSAMKYPLQKLPAPRFCVHSCI